MQITSSKRAAAAAILLFLPGLAEARAQQVNLQTDVFNVLPLANGGFGLNTVGLMGCPLFNGTGVTISPANCGSGSSSGITSLTGAVTATGPGAAAATIAPSGVAPGSYTLGSQIVAINAAGQITSVGSPFSMTISCSAAGSFELGYASTNPNTCTFTYANGTVASGTVGDGTNTTTLTTPFTTGALAFSYTSNTTFTGHATATNSQAASATTSFAVNYCTFAGVGNAGGTGATASGSGACLGGETATITGASSTIPAVRLGLTTAGESFSFNPSGQYIILLLSGGCSHTLTVNTFVTTFNTTALTYTNYLGGSQSGMCLYYSPTYYTGAYTVAVQSL